MAHRASSDDQSSAFTQIKQKPSSLELNPGSTRLGSVSRDERFLVPNAEHSSARAKNPNLLDVKLNREFLSLRTRSGSTSTPFLSKTVSLCNSGVRPTVVNETEATAKHARQPPRLPDLSAVFSNDEESKDTVTAKHSEKGVSKGWTHFKLQGSDVSIMSRSKSHLTSSDDSGLGTPDVKPKRYTLANFKVSSSYDSGFCELSSLYEPSIDSACSSRLQSPSSDSLLFDSVLQSVTPECPDRLIGRKMGLDCVDILLELSVRQVSACMSQILCYLTPQDLFSVSKVSRQWKEILRGDTKAWKRYQLQSLRTKGKENPRPTSKSKALKKTMSMSSGALKEVQFTGHSTKPDTDSDLIKAELKPGESMRKCPRCQGAAKVTEVMERGQCERANCKFDFCARCLDNFHGSKPCSLVLGKHRPECQTVALNS